MWQIEVRHKGLNKYRLIRGSDKYIVEQKAEAQLATWNEMWAKKIQNLEAREKTEEAQQAIGELENILDHTLSINDAIIWETLKDRSDFTKPKPLKPVLLTKPKLLYFPWEPKETGFKYQPEFGFLDKVSSSRRQRKLDEAKNNFKLDYEKWVIEKEEVIKLNEERNKQFEDETNKIIEEYQLELQMWEVEKLEFLNNQKEKNELIEKRKEEYISKNRDAIVDYCEMVLSNSKYPDYFPQEFELDYNSESQILIVDYSLPIQEGLPKIKEVKYNQSRDEEVEVFLPEATLNKLYDSVVYQICLRTIHELFEADVAGAIKSIVFNGWVESIDKGTGKPINACIISLQTSKEEFQSIDLSKIEPKTCFKTLKGIGSSKLHSITPIAPVLQINREDKRFISSYEVANSLDNTTNLAAMDWEDFEHLIRELFEKEFKQTGGEVKVTQASRDGGVDAVAFDPDPIRGGKIVIQAKRYTNTVGVSAVRDLFGTVMNEGATKGILVATSDYGPDAYEFAKGKPLTLLNGGNLLNLLEKHGHKAKIDLKEAKQILAEKEK
ncbi:MAG: restriction endonuclease [Ignavibacteria bacterium]|nr:restriction endonuclease [Ignavibacteria bacterium]